MVAPVGFKPPDENDLATPAREITSRYRVDRRSLLPQRRVVSLRGMPPAASAETFRPVAARWTNRGCACQLAAVLDHDVAITVDFSCATSPTGCRTEVREEKHRHFADLLGLSVRATGSRPQNVRGGSFSTERADLACHWLSASTRKRPSSRGGAICREGPQHKVAARQPAAREQKPRGR